MRRLIVVLVTFAAILAASPAPADGYIPYFPDVVRAVTDKTGLIGGFPATQISSGSTSTTYRHHLHVSAATGFYNLQLIYACAYLVNASEDAPCPNAMTVKAVIAYNGANYAVSFNGTTGSYSLGTGAWAVSDPVGITIPAGADVYVCTYVTVASGGWPVGRAMASSIGGEGTNGTNGADATGSCAVGTGMTSGGYSFGPAAIIGHPLIRGLPAIGLIGDSICAGSGDAYNTVSGYAGYIERGLSNTYAWLSSCRSTDQINFFLAHAAWRLAYFPQYITSVINELGTNDVQTGGNSAATVEANLTALYNEFKSRGVAAYQTTLLPRTSSTDFWTTAANQTPATNEAVRTAVNDWIRTTPPPLSGFFEVANLVEVNSSGVLTQDGGRWNTAGSFTISGNTHTSTTIDNLSTTSGLVVGMPVNCSGCASGTQISSINAGASSMVVSLPTTSTLTGTTVAINPPTYDGIHPSMAVTSTLAASIAPSKLQ